MKLILTNQSNLMELFGGKIEILKQETGELVKISSPNIEVAVTLIITHIVGNRKWGSTFLATFQPKYSDF